MEQEAKPLAASGQDRVRVCCWLLLELCLPTDRMAVHTRWGSCMTSGDHAVDLQVAVCACFWGLLENMAPSKSRSTDCKGETPDMCGGLGILTPTISLILHSLWEVIVIIVPILQIWGTDTHKPVHLYLSYYPRISHCAIDDDLFNKIIRRQYVWDKQIPLPIHISTRKYPFSMLGLWNDRLRKDFTDPLIFYSGKTKAFNFFCNI